MLLTRLLYWDVDWVTASPSWSNKSRPITDFSPSAINVNVAESQVQPLLVIGDCIFPSTWIGSFERVRSCGDTFALIQKARGLLCSTRDASERLRILHALPESTSIVVLILPILIGILMGYNFSTAFSITATVLSSPLLQSDSKSLAGCRKFTESSGCGFSSTTLTIFFLEFCGFTFLCFLQTFAKWLRRPQFFQVLPFALHLVQWFGSQSSPQFEQ